jgi:hypothetical protein
MSLKKLLDEQKKKNRAQDKLDALKQQKKLADDDARLIEEINLLDDTIEAVIENAISENKDYATLDISHDLMIKTAIYEFDENKIIQLNTRTVRNPRSGLIAKYKEMGIDVVFEWYKMYDTEYPHIRMTWKTR